MWFLYALLGALLDATYYASIKKMVRNIDITVLASGVFMSASMILLLFSVLNGIPQITSAFYSAIISSAILNILAASLYFRSLKMTDISLAIPMVSFTPVFLILTSSLLLGESPTFYGMIGILMIVAGSYAKNMRENISHPFAPFREIYRNRGVFYMLLAAFLYSVTTNFTKIAIINSDPFFAPFVLTLVLGIFFLALSFVKHRKVAKAYKSNITPLIVGGSIFAASFIVMNIALTMQIVPYVISLKRLSILFSVLYGGFVLKEKQLGRRTFAALLMIIGMFLIVAS